ncbi:MAG: CBS domain-containing protein [Anaerolineales bacterium]|nr:CBS domain-containing protein [Chloroflexota bacterium]MBL6982626.1 CBS domain-containing protein [Anaerolineales bacterium]
MLVKDYMTRHPIMISPDTPASDAQKMMIENNVRHLPVVGDGKRIVGLITRDRLRVPPTDLGSLNVWEISRILSDLKVKDMMVKGKDLFSIGPDMTLEEAAQAMIKNKVGCLPVVEDDVVVGIITEVDMLAELSDLLGGTVEGVRITVRVPDKVGEYAKITSAIAEKGWGIYTSGGVPAPKRPGFWDVILKVRNVSRDDLVAVIKEIDGQEVIDAREVP